MGPTVIRKQGLLSADRKATSRDYIKVPWPIAMVTPIRATEATSLDAHNMDELLHRPASRTTNLMHDLRRTPVARQVMPQEGSFMCPFHYRANAQIYLILPIYL